jgi:hypothetical protein
MGLGEAGILDTILLILGTILLETFSSVGEDYLGNEDSSRSSGRQIFRSIGSNSSRRIFHGIR